MAKTHGQSEQLEAGVRVGDFEIERRLGAGGMGIVYQARQVSLNRRVALKVLGSALTRETDLTRFQREAQAAARLKHPGIAGIHYVGQDAELCYHVMELVDGIPVQRVIERLAQTKEVQASPDTVVAAELTAQQVAPALRFDQPVANDQATDSAGPSTADEARPPEAGGPVALSAAAKQTRSGTGYIRRCCEIVRDAARALAYAHDEGVVHRDIKPGNLMIEKNGQVRIIDFGLARYFDDISVTYTGQLIGTPLYMSPEQVSGRVKVDHRTDIYSLGLVLYELLALRRPFEFTSRENLLTYIVTKPLPPLCGRNPMLPKALESVVHKATDKDPQERYQTAAELANELDRFLAGKPVSAPPYRYRLDLQETLARRPGGVVISAFICFMTGFLVFMALASMGAMVAVMTDNYAIVAIQTVLGVAVLVATAVMSRGMLAGWGWMRWVVLILAGVVALASLGGAITMGLTAYSMARLITAGPPAMFPLPGDDASPPGGPPGSDKKPAGVPGRAPPTAPPPGTPPAGKSRPETAPAPRPVGPGGETPPGKGATASDPDPLAGQADLKKLLAEMGAKAPPEFGPPQPGAAPPMPPMPSADEDPIQTQTFLYSMFAMYSVPLVVAFLCATATFVCLIHPTTRAWFRLAGRARREHREMLASLGD